MAAAFTKTTTTSSRLMSLLGGVLMSAVVLGSFPDVDYTTSFARNLRPVKQVQVVAQDGTQASAAKPTFDTSTVAGYLSREWKLGSSAASQVAVAFATAARRHHIDPLLLMAVAAAESSFNHGVGNPGGGADPMRPFGIMQVAGRYHPEKFPQGEVQATTVGQNIDIGARILKEYMGLEAGNERRALLRYNGSLNISDKYFQKVSRFKRQLLLGLRRQQDAAVPVASR